MRRHVSIAALVLGWLCANGAIWNVVQVVAWARMIHDYSQVMPAARAVTLALSGDAPCDVCKFVDTARDTAGRELPRDAALGATDKLVLALHPSAPIVLPVPDSTWPPIGDFSGSERREPVPLPPPRIC